MFVPAAPPMMRVCHAAMSSSPSIASRRRQHPTWRALSPACRRGRMPWCSYGRTAEILSAFSIRQRVNLRLPSTQPAFAPAAIFCSLPLPEVGSFHLGSAGFTANNLSAQNNLHVLLIAGGLCCTLKLREISRIGKKLARGDCSASGYPCDYNSNLAGNAVSKARDDRIVAIVIRRQLLRTI